MNSIVLIIVFLFYFIAFAACAAMYVMNGIAILNLCRKLAIPNGGLGFVPIANAYKLGQIADRASAINGEKKNYARLLLTFQIIMYTLFIPLTVCIISLAVVGSYNGYSNNALPIMFIPIIFMIYFALLAVAIVGSVFTYIAYYKIFRLFAPENAVLYLVLSIVIGFSWLFLLIVSLKKPALPPPNYYQPYPPMQNAPAENMYSDSTHK